MIELEELTVAPKGGEPLFERQSCLIPSGALTALTGRNGCGKSTLLRTIGGMVRARHGRVLLGPDRIDVGSTAAGELARILSIVTTGRISARHLTCRQVVEMGRSPHTGLFGRLHPDDRRAVDRAMEIAGIGSLGSRDVATVSDGEHQRVMLARALAQDTSIILLDEPTGFLDVPNRRAVTSLLAMMARETGKCILYSTHEVESALANSDYILHIADRRLALMPPGEMRNYGPFVAMVSD